MGVGGGGGGVGDDHRLKNEGELGIHGHTLLEGQLAIHDHRLKDNGLLGIHDNRLLDKGFGEVYRQIYGPRAEP